MSLLYSEVACPLKDASNRDRQRLTRLLEASKLSERKSRHASAVYRGGSLLSLGINTTRVNSPYVIAEDHPFPSEHAEMAALRQVGNPQGTTVYVARSKRDGTPGMSRPCPACSKVLRESGVKKVIYTVDED